MAERALALYNRLKATLESQEAYFADAANESLTLAALEVRTMLLEPLRGEMIVASLECAAGAIDWTEHADIEERILTLLTTIREMISTLKAESASRDASFVRQPGEPELLPVARPKPSALRTPKLEIPKFDGSLEKWPRYRDMFTSLVHDNKELSDMMKFSYLDSTFEIPAGKPNVLASFPMTEACYKEAWKAVCDRYNDKRRLIFHHMSAMFGTKKMSSYSADELLRVIDSFTTNLSALGQHGLKLEGSGALAEAMLVHQLTSRLDDEVLREWRKEQTDDVPKWKELVEYLTTLWRSVQDFSEPKKTVKSTESKSTESKPTKSKTFVANNSEAAKPNQCVLCQLSHALWTCPTFKAMPSEDRWNVVKGNRLCFICFAKGHSVAACPRTNLKCRKCGRGHGALLHFERSADAVEQSRESLPSGLNPTTSAFTPFEMKKKFVFAEADPTISMLASNAFVVKQRQTLLSTVSVLVTDGDGDLQLCRALLDSGSDSHFMTTACADRLKLNKISAYRPVLGIHEQTTIVKSRVRAKIASRYGRFEKVLDFSLLSNITGDLPGRDVDVEALHIPEDLFLADPKFHRSADVDMLLNNALYLESLLAGKIERPSLPTLQETKFGWIIGGETLMESPSTSSALLCSFCRVVKPEAMEIEEKLERFLAADEVEFAGTTLNAEEKFCEKLFEETTRTGKDGKLIVEMPMKSNFHQLGKNLRNAKRTLAWQETERKKDVNYDRLYCEYLDEYIKSGFMSEVEPRDDEIAHYLPHHGVLKLTSTSTKLRPVFNASSKSETGLSLNDVLCVGPMVQDESFDLMLRFREKKFVITADIKKMFLQVWVEPKQRRYLRILWRADMSDPIKHYELNTVTFGTACAPYLAQRSLKYLAEKNIDRFPEGAKTIANSFYMDDWIHSTDSTERGRVERDQVRMILAPAGMLLCKYSSNTQELLADLPPSLVEQPDDENLTSKTLGIVYRANADQFSYDLKPMDENRQLTRVEAMSQVASIYDPIGWIGPVLMTAKLYLKKLCLMKLDWKDQIPDEMQDEWNAFRNKFEELNAVRLSRHCFVDNHVNIELHGFSDASIVGYGAVIYALSSDRVGNNQVSLICAKSRVAPKNQKTLARLELCGATLLAKLIDRTRKIFTVNIDEVTLWNDSTIALSWMAITPTSRLQTFVGNRVAVIQELTHKFVWKHIKGTENPADVISRGLAPDELKDCELWWSGPKFLRSPKSEWPMSIITINEEDPEVKQEMKRVLVAGPCNELLKYIETRWSRPRVLIRCVAWMLRFKENMKTSRGKKILRLTIEEQEKAKIAIVRCLQKNFFAQEYKILERAKTEKKETVEMPRKSPLRALSPFLDEEMVMRVGGRLERSPCLTYEEKHQLILPESHFATIVLREMHEDNLHPGPLALLSIVRQRYWPMKAMQTIKKVTKGCLRCFRAKPTITRQLMSDLPEARVAPSSPFTETALDYAGYYSIKCSLARKSSNTKAYVALFKCMSTLAIHLELVTDLSSAAFIAAFDRFVSRRGLCRRIYCDNGTAFVGADNELKKIASENQEDVEAYCNGIGVEFKFTTPRAPHAGGIYESGIKSMKKHLRIAMGTSSYTYERFATILCKVEAILNSRPLTPMSEDPNDLRVLTPGHFLIGKPLIAKPERRFKFIPTNRLDRWDELQKIQQSIWRDWQRDYLHQLQKRPVDFRAQFEVNVGDLVLVHEPNLPTLKWLLGRVTKTMPGRDKVVRNVLVKTINGEKERHVRYVSFLPFERNLPIEAPEGVSAET